MKVKVIMNPVAGRGKAQKVKPLLLETLRGYGCDFHFEETERPHHATEIAQKSVKSGFDLIMVAGGDGTINQVVNGMAGSNIPLGIIACGTGNDFAAALGMPPDPVASIRQIMEGEIQKIDLCRVNDRYFVSSAGAGFDGEVAYNVNQGFRWVRGMTAYLLGAIKTLFSYKPRRIKLTIDGLVMEFDATLVAVTNAPTYGGGFKVNPEARLNDGLLDICAAQAMSIPGILCCLPLVMVGRHQGLKKVRMFKGRNITLESEQLLHLQLDGEVLTDKKLHFVVLPQALLIKGSKLEPVPYFDLLADKPACAREA
ncbi:MAG: diacylglycerol kinase family lipid kinase [Firmicutes bacterium]|nr:diacylglycerol kinase family lipid kinase [Bacillota bacterium]